MKDGTEHVFSLDGLHLQTRDRNSNTFTYAYVDATGDGKAEELSTITTPVGTQYSLTYFGGKLASITDPAGRATSFLHDATGNLTRITNPDGTSRQFAYDSNHVLQNQTDERGFTTRYEYDEFGLVSRAVLADGSVRQFQPSDRVGLVASAGGSGSSPTAAVSTADVRGLYTDARGNTISRKTDSLGGILESTDQLGFVTRYERDENSLPTEMTDARGFVSTYQYDEMGNRLSGAEPLGGVTTYEYEENFNEVTRMTDPLGRVTTYEHDANGNRISSTDPLGHSTAYSYNACGQIVSMTDARGNTTTYEYNAACLRSRITHPDGSFRSMTYDAAGNKLTETDELGHTVTYTYDAHNRMLASTDPLGRTTTYSYDQFASGGSCSSCSGGAQNLVTSITLPSGKTTTLTYDERGRKLSQTVGAGTAEAATTNYSYDDEGNLIAMTDPLGRVWTYAYNERGERTSASDPLGNTTQWTYDEGGNRLTETRPDGGVSDFAYDALDRLVQSTDPLNQTTTMAYDAVGNMLTLMDANNNTYSFTYDAPNRRTSMIYPDASHEDYAYDSVGNLATYRNRGGNVRTYTYDNRNRELLSVWNDGVTPSVSRSYDAAGRLLTLDNGVSALSYAYDNANQLFSETSVGAALGQARTVSYAYDQDGNRASLTYPSGTVVSYTYTARNQMATVTADGGPPLATYAYDLAGNRVAKTLENGTSTAYSYDEASRLLTIVHNNNGGQFARFDYSLNSVGNRTSKTQSGSGVPPVLTESYSYDATDQLTGVNYAENGAVSRSISYQYDPVGNRQNVTENGQPTSYTANNLSQYTAVDAQPLGYDAKGNLSAVGTAVPGGPWAYTYDAQNRLISASSSSSAVHFSYDARNRCVSRTINGTTTYFIWDSWNLLEDRDPTGAALAEYVHGALIDEILVRYNGSPIYYHHDALGCTTHLTDGNGGVVEQYRYDVYGAATILGPELSALGTSHVNNRFLFAGRENVAELSLYDFRRRLYAPGLGRFLQTDPNGFYSRDSNLYRYVRNNVPNLLDPFGLETEKKEDKTLTLEEILKKMKELAQQGKTAVEIWEAVKDVVPANLKDILGPTGLLESIAVGTTAGADAFASSIKCKKMIETAASKDPKVNCDCAEYGQECLQDIFFKMTVEEVPPLAIIGIYDKLEKIIPKKICP